jgi:hypothetical protein
MPQEIEPDVLVYSAGRRVTMLIHAKMPMCRVTEVDYLGNVLTNFVIERTIKI